MRREDLTALENTAVIYARYSSHNQREESIEAQVRACREYANNRGLQVIEIYADSAKTGTNADREKFLLMIEDGGRKRFKNLIVHKLDRFSRDKHDAVIYKRKLKVNGVKIFSVTENLDDSPESQMLESLLEGMAQYYSSNLAREVMKGMKESAYKCTHLGGFSPLGYDVCPVTKKYVINEAEAEIIRIIFKKYADGIGYNQILNYLNSLGYRTKQGKPFGKNSLYSILKNEKYMGKFTFNKKLEKGISGKRNPKLKPKEEWIVVEGGLPAIIDEAIFIKVQTKMAQNQRNGGRCKAKRVYLLSGLVVCGVCGASMYGNTRRCGRNETLYSSYRCSNRDNHQGCTNKEIRKKYLEGYVLDRLYQTLFSDISIKKLARMLNKYKTKKAAEFNQDLSRAKNELKEVMKKIAKVIQLVSESGITIDTVKDELKKFEGQKQLTEKRIEELNYKDNDSLITEDQIFDLIARSRQFVKTQNIPECRNFIESYIEQVIIHEEKVEVRFKIHVPDEETDTVVPLTSEKSITAIQTEFKKVV